MSWFLFPVAPALLMLAALGLERLESGLDRVIETSLVATAETLLFGADTQPIAVASVANRGNPRFRSPRRTDPV